MFIKVKDIYNSNVLMVNTDNIVTIGKSGKHFHLNLTNNDSIILSKREYDKFYYTLGTGLE